MNTEAERIERNRELYEIISAMEKISLIGNDGSVVTLTDQETTFLKNTVLPFISREIWADKYTLKQLGKMGN